MGDVWFFVKLKKAKNKLTFTRTDRGSDGAAAYDTLCLPARVW